MTTRTLGGVEVALEDVDRQARSRVLNIDDPFPVEKSLFAVLPAWRDERRGHGRA